MFQTQQYIKKQDRKNCIDITTSHSHDGRSLDSFWVKFDDEYHRFLLEFILDSSPRVKQYRVFGPDGKCIKDVKPDNSRPADSGNAVISK